PRRDLGLRGLSASRARAGDRARRGPGRPARPGDPLAVHHRGGLGGRALIAELLVPRSDRARPARGPRRVLRSPPLLDRRDVPLPRVEQPTLHHHGRPAHGSRVEPPRGLLMAGRTLGDARGFTLLEVLVAFAILAVAIVSLIELSAQGLRLLKVSGDHQRA